MRLLFTFIDHISDAGDRSLFNLPVLANGADGFKLALYLISCGLQGVDARIVHTQHDEIIVEARDDIAGQVQGIVRYVFWISWIGEDYDRIALKNSSTVTMIACLGKTFSVRQLWTSRSRSPQQ
ncbi:MAG: hypothetical protein ACLP51_21065, partial [Syntrophobacteraceae bacterium]